MSVERRRQLIDPRHPRLPVTRQCELVSISRSGFYYQPAGGTLLNLALMRLIDEQFLETPWYGSRQMMRHLRREGYMVGRKRVRRLMARMGLEPIYQRPRTTVPHPGHRVYPYLLRDMVIDRPNQVWCADITYIPMRRGFHYLVAIMDWSTRKVLSWRLSNTMDAEFCIEALEEALMRFGRPEIFNTDQGSQFTSPRFTGVLETAGVRISMDGRGRWMDNVFIVSANFDARGGECLRLERMMPSDEPGLSALRSCYRASAGVLVRSAFSEVERHQILDVVIWWAQR